MSESVNELSSGPVMRNSRITINLTPELHAQLRHWAAAEDRSVSNLCLQLIEASMAVRRQRQ